jgi:hypothetical protein
VGLKLNGTHQIPVYADVNLLGVNLNTVTKHRYSWCFNVVSKEVDLYVNPEKIKYMSMSRHQNAGQYDNMKIANRSFENVEKFTYLGTTVTDQNLIHEEIERRLNSGNACYHSVQKHLSSSLLSKNVKIRIYKTIILL